MAKSATQVKTQAIDAPVTQDQAEKLLADIGRLQRKVGNVENEMNNKLLGIKDKYEKQAQPLNDEISVKFHALHIYAEANKSELLKGKLKTAKLSTGELSWRTTPPSCRISNAKVVIETLKRMDLHDLIRSKEEVNKEAVLSDPARVEGVKGITVTQKEEFVAKPFESQIERAEPVKKAQAA